MVRENHPKNSSEQPLDQGMLFPVEVSRTAPPSIGEAVEGGVYPDELSSSNEDSRPFHEVVHEAVVQEQHTRNRRQGNQGKHSPLQRDGNYQQIRLGDFLPGFGPVTERRWEEAKAHARGLEDKRLKSEGLQPAIPIAKSSTSKDDEPVPIGQVISEATQKRNQAIAARQRRKGEAHAKLKADLEKAPRRGGAFGGALKRRILATDSEETRARTNEHDIALIAPTNLRPELFPLQRGNLSRDGVLFTPEEYGAITVSPAEFSNRVGAHVLKHTTERAPTERHARRDEVVKQQLQKRYEAARDTLQELQSESEQIERLRKEMRSPGYAHMTLDDMDGLMKTTEGVMNKMFRAIIENRGLNTERTDSLTAAMEYLVTADDYRQTFTFWQQMSSLAKGWTDAKIKRFTTIEMNLIQELER
jgi:hypothetical protein